MTMRCAALGVAFFAGGAASGWIAKKHHHVKT